jgi:Adenylate and Guanylate cyclase catalytic domain
MELEEWASDLQKVTTMFINLGVDLSQLNDKKGLYLFHGSIKILQSCIYQSKGSLNKLLMDDKGSTLIVIFGAHPMSHKDDASRAISCALSLTSELSKINIRVNIGITTGKVFTGVIGTPGGRREFSLLGDGVNLAARLM